jgi:hypothetical protein
MARAKSGLLWLLFLIPVGIEVAGFYSTKLLALNTWEPLGMVRFERYCLFFAALTAVFALARRFFIPVVAGAVLLCSAYAVGVVPVAAVLLFVFSATVLGKLVFGESIENCLAFLSGTALWIAAMYVVARLPIHYSATYLVALALPIAAGHRYSRQLALDWIDVFRPSRLDSFAEFGAFAMLAFVLVADWLVVLEPEASPDGLAMHLTIAARIATSHAFTADFRQVTWALMPMGADFCYAVLNMIGGEFAARLLNFAMLAVMALLLFHAGRSLVSRPVAITMAAVFVSTPLVFLVTGSMFVENFLAAMTLGAVVALWRYHKAHSTGYLMVTQVLLGTAMAMKLAGLAAGILGVAVLAFEVWRSRAWRIARPARVATCAFAVLIVIAAFPYANAWVRSGNPVFPFENRIFHSPWLWSAADQYVVDARFQRPLSWSTPQQLTFYTNRYYEGRDGSFGFQYLLFLPLFVAFLAGARSFEGRSAVIIGGGGALIVAATQPNARYMYLALPVLTLGMLSVLAWLRPNHSRLFRAAVAATLAAGVLNIRVMPRSDWVHLEFYSEPLFSQAARQTYVRQHIPIRAAIAYVNRQDPAQPVLNLDNPITAGLLPPVYTMAWHDLSFVEQAQLANTPDAFYRLLSGLSIGRVIVDRDIQIRGIAVDTVLKACGEPRFSFERFTVLKLRPDCAAELKRLPSPGCPPGIAPLLPGHYDETDPRITFQGKWTFEKKFPSTFGGTIHYSNSPGDQICFSIEGVGFDYVFTRAFNRGMALILVDGKEAARLDAYSPNTKWQAHASIANLAPRRHDILIRVLPARNSAATDYYVDLDSVVVE